MTTPICCGARMATATAFVSGKTFHRCTTCRANDYGWWRWDNTRSAT